MSTIVEKIKARQKEVRSTDKVTQQVVVVDVKYGVGRMNWFYFRQERDLLCLRL